LGEEIHQRFEPVAHRLAAGVRGLWLPLYRYTRPNGQEVDEFVQCQAQPCSIYTALRQADDDIEGEVLDWSLWTNDEII
jgi:hypothetical protein